MMIDLSNKKIGILGFGIVGKSAAEFLYNRAHVTVMDKKRLSPMDQEFLTAHAIGYVQQTDAALATFIQEHDYIVASPGIDLRPYPELQKKLLPELDLFTSFFCKSLISITGTVGKTSVTHLLTTLLQQTEKRWVNGGNIGIGMLDLIALQDNYDGAVLEVSSFQLEHCRSFAPDLAIWTNFYPNHLDRHGTLDAYLHAKMNCVLHQRQGQQALLPFSLLENAYAKQLLKSAQSTVSFFALKKPKQMPQAHAVFWLENNLIIQYFNGISRPLIDMKELPAISFPENWLIIVAAFSLLRYKVPSLAQISFDNTVLEHRLEKVATINTITFYNDSKSTVPEATLAALARCKNPFILLLGGMSKGIDRAPLIASLKQFPLRHLITFGKEAEHLESYALENGIPCSSYESLEDAFAESVRLAHSGDTILLSPAGASFDLFTDYKQRGKRFKELVQEFKQKQEMYE
jgi:UDP-N-acetylmuramoylalanine--D-glutamate ligase